MFKHWLKKWTNTYYHKSSTKMVVRRPILRIESLEDRTVPSTYLGRDINTGTNGSNPVGPTRLGAPCSSRPPMG